MPSTATAEPRHPAGHVFRNLDTAGRAFARTRGYVGKRGGWIYDEHGCVGIQGYAGLGAFMVQRGVISRYDNDRGGWVVLRPF